MGRGDFCSGESASEKQKCSLRHPIPRTGQEPCQMKRNVRGGDHRKGEPFQIFCFAACSLENMRETTPPPKLSELACSFLFSSHSRAECWTHRERKQRKGGRREAGQRLQSASCICAGGERRWTMAKKRRDSPIRTFTGILRGVAFVCDLDGGVSHRQDLSQIKCLNTRKDVLASQSKYYYYILSYN